MQTRHQWEVVISQRRWVLGLVPLGPPGEHYCLAQMTGGLHVRGRPHAWPRCPARPSWVPGPATAGLHSGHHLLMRRPRSADPLLHYLHTFSKGPEFSSAPCPGPSRVHTAYTKKTALPGMMYGPLAGACLSPQDPAPRAGYCWGHSPGKVARGQIRMMLSLSVTRPAGQTHPDGPLPGMLERCVVGSVREGRGRADCGHGVTSPQ